MGGVLVDRDRSRQRPLLVPPSSRREDIFVAGSSVFRLRSLFARRAPRGKKPRDWRNLGSDRASFSQPALEGDSKLTPEA